MSAKTDTLLVLKLPFKQTHRKMPRHETTLVCSRDTKSTPKSCWLTHAGSCTSQVSGAARFQLAHLALKCALWGSGVPPPSEVHLWAAEQSPCSAFVPSAQLGGSRVGDGS